MLELDKRPCKLGVYLNTPTQKHGEERVPAKVLGLKNILLTKDDLCELLGTSDAWDMLYLEVKGKSAMPLFEGKLGALNVLGKFKESSLTLSFGLKPHELEFVDATLKSLKLDRQEGGLTALSLTVVCLKSNIRGPLAMLDDHLDSSAHVALELGDPEDEDEDDEDSKQEALGLSPAGNVGTPEQERTRAADREKRLAKEIEDDRARTH